MASRPIFKTSLPCSKALATLSLILFAIFGADPANAVVGGLVVTDEVFTERHSWRVLVINDDTGKACGGSLIAPTWVLTAAHCIGGKHHILHGSAVRSAAARAEIKRAFRHPDFDSRTGRYDLGLIELQTALDGATASLMEPYDSRVRLSKESVLELAGWGRTRRGIPAKRLLAETFVARELLLDNYLIVMDAAAGPCSQDSGSALIARTPDKVPVIVGIASRTDGNLCSKPDGGYSIYARVDRAVDFFSRFDIPIN